MDRHVETKAEYLPTGDVRLTFDGTVKKGVAHKVMAMLVSEKDVAPEKKLGRKPRAKAAKRKR
jgi:hypothetical protein